MDAIQRSHKTGKDIQKAIIRWVRSNLRMAVVYNIEIASERGVPDLIMCLDGEFVGVEVKGKGDKLQRIQKAQLKRIRNAGGTAIAVTSLDDFKQKIEPLLTYIVRTQGRFLKPQGRGILER